MRHNQPDSSRDDRERQRQLQDLAGIELRLKAWTFELNDGIGSLPDALQTESDIREAIDADNTSVVMVEVDKMLEIMKSRYVSTEQKVELTKNEVDMLTNEITNKIIHKMDTEDIRYSINRQLVLQDKLEIFSEAAQTYCSLLESLKGMQRLRQESGGYMQVKRIIHSEFYECRVKARLCYEDCCRKLMLATRQISVDRQQQAYMQHKSAVNRQR